jgi:hypothetical protein
MKPAIEDWHRRHPVPLACQLPESATDAQLVPKPPGSLWRRFWRPYTQGNQARRMAAN